MLAARVQAPRAEARRSITMRRRRARRQVFQHGAQLFARGVEIRHHSHFWSIVNARHSRT